MDAYGTHIPMLAAALAHTMGSVLELGVGHNSTPIIHAACRHREVLSAEDKLDWFRQFIHYRTSDHAIVCTPTKAEQDAFIEGAASESNHWGLIFVDHAPGERRAPDIAKLKRVGGLFVVHDTEEAGYCYEPVLRTFNFRFDYKNYRPWTSVLSDTDPLHWIR